MTDSIVVVGKEVGKEATSRPIYNLSMILECIYI